MKRNWLIIGAILLFLGGGCYILAAMGIAFEDRLGDEIGGAWFQGLVTWAVAIGALVWVSRLEE